MAHLFAPQPSNIELPVFFNVDGVVGAPPAANNKEDVLLVQFIFNVIGKSPLPTTPPEVTAVAKTVKVTGTMDAATVNAIRTHQENQRKKVPATVVDGRVSPAKGGYSYGAIWTIAHLNNSLQERSMSVWPRIDKVPGCPAELQAMVMRAVVGT